MKKYVFMIILVLAFLPLLSGCTNGEKRSDFVYKGHALAGLEHKAFGIRQEFPCKGLEGTKGFFQQEIHQPVRQEPPRSIGKPQGGKGYV